MNEYKRTTLDPIHQKMPLSRTVIEGFFCTGRILGRGSFCIVKEVIHTDPAGSGSIYALKQPRGDLSLDGREHAQASLINEISILQNINHPNIVRIR